MRTSNLISLGILFLVLFVGLTFATNIIQVETMYPPNGETELEISIVGNFGESYEVCGRVKDQKLCGGVSAFMIDNGDTAPIDKIETAKTILFLGKPVLGQTYPSIHELHRNKLNSQ